MAYPTLQPVSARAAIARRVAGGIIIASLGAAVSTSAAWAQTKKSWKCSAPSMVNSSYDGGSSAYIHLEGFSSGGNYPVTLNSSRTVANGTTANGTKFTCKLS
ncbi:hypothetical protein ABLE93_00255 [Xanthobacter sp. KR7-65]|uniref:hypothetical protein n=1 Tax=Xanthobacter sp. KR7-65 TaxID=3156612 RepID=UPI0032B34B03